jgi:thiamine-phosphate pyrophosphorylase
MLHQRIKGLYGITPDKDLNIALIENAIKKHKVNILQYRRKTQDEKHKLDEATQLLELCLQHNTLFIVNDDVNLCKKIGANGVHLGQNDVDVHSARSQLGDKFIIGVSCYNNLELAIEAEKNGADYIALGAIFKSSTKPDAAYCSLSTIQKIKHNINIPIVGIGGVTFENQQSVLDAGCNSIAMIEGLFGH